MKTHKHHIVPKHAGGTNDISNIIELTPQQHAEAHRLLWEQHRRWQDYLAWQGLSGRMGREDIIREKSKLANIGRKPWSKGRKIGPRPDDVKRRISDTMKAKGIRPSAEVIKIGLEKAHEAVRGRNVTEEERRKRSNALKKFNKEHPRSFRPRSELSKAKTSKKLCKSVEFRGVVYQSLKDCKQANNLTRYWIVKDSSFRFI